MNIPITTIRRIAAETGIHRQTIMAVLLGNPLRSKALRPILDAALARHGLVAPAQDGAK